jgi:hypothetical protein
MTDNPAAFIATETGQQKTFTVTYTFPDGAVEAATECCRRAGLTVIDTTDDATIECAARAMTPHYWTPVFGEHARNNSRDIARNVLAALRGGAA